MMLTTEPKVRYTKYIFLFLRAGDRPKDLDYALSLRPLSHILNTMDAFFHLSL